MREKLKLHEQITKELKKPEVKAKVNEVNHGKIIFYIQDGKLIRGEARYGWKVEDEKEDLSINGRIQIGGGDCRWLTN